MYEWPKNDLANFRKLDHNGDGFLTPEELANPGRGAAYMNTLVVGSTSGAPGGSGSGAMSRDSRGGRRGSDNSPAAAPAVAQPPADLKTVAATGAFELLDADKNGQLSEEEWNRSRHAKKLFTEGKVEVQFPFPKEKFVENYVKLSP